MTLNELVTQGYAAKDKCIKYYEYNYAEIKGPEYEEWLQCSLRFLESNYKGQDGVDRFRNIVESSHFDAHNFDIAMAILKSFVEIPSVNKINIDTNIIIENICLKFNRCIKQLQNRHKNRNTLEINDEYDVQDLLHGLLRLFFDDVRSEDWVPEYAGGTSRTDFNLPQYDLFIETKMTRDTLRDKEVGEQLSIDIARYSQMCKTLVCFIYDSGGFLKNPIGLKRDLEALSTDNFEIKVYISPL